eukprot:TRINITY_DN31903_c0_g1_i1.p1 TRINITY_DN31903_c0_g1~~TRINITY_DN31903_c0_g1_i1.p1  ORF type:complete len:908 (-),score=137.23 TRINITY_DN31903_c0_g1_i1:211-2934(-)
MAEGKRGGSSRTVSRNASASLANGLVPPEELPANIRVCVRVRPFAAREIGENCCIEMPSANHVVIKDEQGKPTMFDFDHAFWSHNDSDPHFASQETLMRELGYQFVENTFAGYNNCLFAYGQTGSGKTHSVLGALEGDQRGLLPRTVEEIFSKIEAATKLNTDKSQRSFSCRASYLEIYNEHIRDLLAKADATQKTPKLDVRHHPQLGVFVPGLAEHVVTGLSEVLQIIQLGTRVRATASTSMNSVSSRSHCIFTLVIETVQTIEGETSELHAKVHLVDLAGSERAKKSEAAGDRLKEGSMINQSLSTLALVINTLAEKPASNSGADDFIPFRNSKLTQLLQDSLSGNSRTVLIAALSPAPSNREETMSTLRFAQTCKKVVTHPLKNNDSKTDKIEQLQKELQRVKAENVNSQARKSAMSDQLVALEQLRAKLEGELQLKIAEKASEDKQREQAMEDMALDLDEIATVFKMDKDIPRLINISDDPSLSGSLIYFLRKKEHSMIGSNQKCRVNLTGAGILPFMCSCFNDDNARLDYTLLNVWGKELQADERQGGRFLINGRRPPVKGELKHKDRILVGYKYCFRVNVPLQASDEAMGDELGVEDALQEVVNEDSPAYLEAYAMFESLRERLGAPRVQNFLQVFTQTFPLIDEVNAITEEVRPKDKLRFQLEVCSDIKTFTTDEPELMVRLYQGVGAGKSEQLLGNMELPDFMARVDAIRSIHDNFMSEGPSALHTDLGEDPWKVYTFTELQNDVRKLRDELNELRSRRRSTESDQTLRETLDALPDVSQNTPKQVQRGASKGASQGSPQGAVRFAALPPPQLLLADMEYSPYLSSFASPISPTSGNGYARHASKMEAQTYSLYDLPRNRSKIKTPTWGDRQWASLYEKQHQAKTSKTRSASVPRMARV